MDRYNIFNQVHKGLRSCLYETALALQQTDFAGIKAGGTILEQLSEVIELFEKHAHTEDHFLLPALAPYEPSVVAAFEDEHDKDHELARRLQELVFVFTHSMTDETRIETGKAINIAFVEFMVFNLEHMAKEESVLNRLLWRYYADEELKQLTQQILAHLSPEIMAKYGRCMMRGLSNPEIVTWLKEVRSNAPDFVLSGLLSTAEAELRPHRWREIRQQLVADTAAVASNKAMK